ncbi:MAG: histidine phosphatase family protein [Chloroflexi bacterium]|nr:histidine phosphatase family protein [Chloroflexota bacterium]
MTMYLIRHGLALAAPGDIDPGLAEMGHAQAAATANWAKGTNASRLIVSPLRRTRETAAPIADALALVPEVRVEVAEVFDPSMPMDERHAMIGPFMAGRWAGQPERLRAWRGRVIGALFEAGLAAAAANRDLIVVSHYIAISVAIGEATGDDRVVPAPMANCSISSFSVGHGGFELLEAASTAHLDPSLVGGAQSAIAGRG